MLHRIPSVFERPIDPTSVFYACPPVRYGIVVMGDCTIACQHEMPAIPKSPHPITPKKLSIVLDNSLRFGHVVVVTPTAG